MNDNTAAPERDARPRPPPSATRPVITWIGAAVTVIAIFWIRDFHEEIARTLEPLVAGIIGWLRARGWDDVQSAPDYIPIFAILLMLATAIGIFVPDLLWQRVNRRSLAATPGPGDMGRTLVKCLGLVGSVGFIALAYFIFPEYHNSFGSGKFYSRYWMLLGVMAPFWIVLAPPYIHYVDRRMAEPRDGLWHMGRFLLLQWQDVDMRAVGQNLLGWMVKGFFLPLMFVAMCDNVNDLVNNPNLGQAPGFTGFYDFCYYLFYFVDVSWVSMTYIMALRLTDTQIRSTEPTALGWSSALLCYQPFWGALFGNLYLAYNNGPEWGYYFAGHWWMYLLWGVLILALVAVYVLSTIAFGGRFSNLTHRGIITHGPYRYLRHPAYLSKNLSWWMISMPFMIVESWSRTVQHCLALLLLNGVYFVRAKTEERHLRRDPVYVAYSKWIDEHGPMRWMARLPLIGRLIRWRLAD